MFSSRCCSPRATLRNCLNRATMSSSNHSSSGDGDDVVRVGLERGIRDLRVIVGESLTLGSENQTGLVERVATEHAADRIGDDLLDDISRHEFVTLGRRVLRVCECWITFQRHSFDRYVAWHFIAHTVRRPPRVRCS